MKIRANVTKVNDENSHVKAYANICVEDCCDFYGIRVVENNAGELFVSYPQKPVYENGEQKLNDEGRPVYTDVYYATPKEKNDAIKELILRAYHSEQGYAYLNPEKGEHVHAKIEPQLHACNGEKVKAAGRLTVGGYMKVPDVFVNLRTDSRETSSWLSLIPVISPAMITGTLLPLWSMASCGTPRRRSKRTITSSAPLRAP